MFSLITVMSEAGHAIIDNNTNEYLPCMKILERKLEMGEDACSTFQGSKSVIWNLFVSVL